MDAMKPKTQKGNKKGGDKGEQEDELIVRNPEGDNYLLLVSHYFSLFLG